MTNRLARVPLLALAAGALFLSAAHAKDASMRVESPRCEYRREPLGIATAAPRFSWELKAVDASSRGLRQTAYRLLVATSASRLKEGQADRWDSGTIASSAASQIEYAGMTLRSGESLWWSVRIWDESGEASAWSTPARFTIGLLDVADWSRDAKAEWIGHDLKAQAPLTEEERASLRARPWLVVETPVARTPQRAEFSGSISVPAGEIASAWFAGTADQEAPVRINGREAGRLTRWEPVVAVDVASLLHEGENPIEITVTQQDGFSPAVTGAFVVVMRDGRTVRRDIDATWKATMQGKAATPVERRGLAWGGNRNTEHFMAPAGMLRTAFTLDKPVRRATLYATALGLYWCEVDGVRVGADEFTPGWTEYSKRVLHQTYDLTASMTPGKHALGAVLGDGWYAGLMGYTGKRHWYGDAPRFMARLELEFADGSRRVIVTDRSWKAAEGPIRHADNYMGCEYDARLEVPGWSKPDFDASRWSPVDVGVARIAERRIDVAPLLRSRLAQGPVTLKVGPAALGEPAYGVVKTLEVRYASGGVEHAITLGEGRDLQLPVKDDRGDLTILEATFGEPRRPVMVVEPQPGEPVRRFETLPAKAVTQPLPGRYVYDLGQNMVGYVRLRAKGERGTRLTLRHAEMLNPDGTIYTSNLRGATAVDFLTLDGVDRTLEPRFTFHGFRYVEISGLREPLPLEAVEGVVLHTDMEPAGSFTCSEPLLNALHHNIIWGQKGNYLEVPTDCPQRDERLGWTGDAQFFINTAGYDFDIASFMSRWLKTLAHDAQADDGTFAHVAPRVAERGGSTAWGDAAIVCTHAMFRRYGDLRLVRDNHEPIARYLAWLSTRTKDGISHVGGFSDWLNLGDPTDNDLIDTAYRIELLRMASEMASAIGKTAVASAYDADRAAALAAFRVTFLQPDGSLRGSGQTGYALAFTMRLLPPECEAKAAAHFAQTIERKGRHLATGFIGTPRLLPALHLAGRDDLAYALLLNTDYPSWLYQVKLGATTMWERWDGWTPERGFSDVGMNSFNHYAFGSVGDYMMSVVAGIKGGDEAFASFELAPVPGPGLDFVDASHHCIRGDIRSSWKRIAGGLEYAFTVPPNTTARCLIPGATLERVTESGLPITKARGVSEAASCEQGVRCTLGSGVYRFVAKTGS